MWEQQKSQEQQDERQPSWQLTITVSELLDALTGIYVWETDRTLCVSVRKSEIVRMCKKKKLSKLFPWAERERMLAALIHSKLWIVAKCKSCYLAHDAPGSSYLHQICLSFPERRQENPQETPFLIGGSLTEEEALPCMYSHCDTAFSSMVSAWVCVVML